MRSQNRLRAIERNLELPNLIEAYLLACRAEGKSPNTVRWYEQKLRTITEFLRTRRLPLDPEQITPEIVRGLVTRIQSRSVSAFTTRGHVQVLKGLNVSRATVRR